MILYDTSANRSVGRVDADRARIEQLASTEASERYVTFGDIELLRGAPPSADTALVDERPEQPATAQELREYLQATYGATPIVIRDEPVEARLATRYDEGDIVETPDGIGVIAGVLSETVANEDLEVASDLPDEVEASSDSPTYVVVIDDDTTPMRFYKAADLQAGEIDTDVDPFGDMSEAAATACLGGTVDDDAEEARLAWSPPESWRKSDTPARLIGLKAFASMNGDFSQCEKDLRGSVATTDDFCAAFFDWLLMNPYWRGDSPLPGD